MVIVVESLWEDVYKTSFMLFHKKGCKKALCLRKSTHYIIGNFIKSNVFKSMMIEKWKRRRLGIQLNNIVHKIGFKNGDIKKGYKGMVEHMKGHFVLRIGKQTHMVQVDTSERLESDH